MSLLVVGLSHRSAPVRMLERAAVAPDDLPKALHELVSAAGLAEVAVLSTCNRVEVYAEVEKFHGGVQDVSDIVARWSGVPLTELTPHLYVHYEDRAVQHLFAVASGLDSMVVGESQILGQLRACYRAGQAEGTVGRGLGLLLREALRVGKRARSETGIDHAGQSLVSVGLELAASTLGPLPGRRALLVGAGSMGALAGATLLRVGVDDVTVANRGLERAQRLAGTLGGRAVGLDQLAHQIAAADLVVCSTGATSPVVDQETVAAAVAGRRGRPLVLLDLALPRDVDEAVRELLGVTVIDLEALRGVLSGEQVGRDVEAVRRIVTAEVAGFLGRERARQVTPTVVALRAQADEVTSAELDRLAARLPGLTAREREEVAVTVRRVVDKLLHAPTVRVRELAEEPGGDSYAAALRELFGLDRRMTEAMVRADVTAPEDVAEPPAGEPSR